MSNRFLQSISIARKIGKWLTIFCSVLLALLMLINVIDIVGKKWFDWGLPGALDISEELMVMMTLLPVGYILLERGHINLSLIEDRQSKTGRFVFQIIKYIAGISIGAFLTWRTFVQFQYVFESKLGKIGFPQFPIWPANLVVAISFGLFTIICVLLLVNTLIMGKEKIEKGQAADSPL